MDDSLIVRRLGTASIRPDSTEMVKSVLNTCSVILNGSIETEPLILTDYINSGKIAIGKEMSKVDSFLGEIESYSGFFRVSDDCVRNMFFWYFPAQVRPAPLLVWLQGGPGAASLYGLFVENGPYYLDSDNNNFRSELDLVFLKVNVILQPKNKLMRQFYVIFTNLRSNPLYITGESYAGKYVPAMVYAIDQYNQNNPTPINLVGMAIGDGLCDPYNTLFFSGQLDIIVPFQMTSAFLRNLEWEGKENFFRASQQRWYSKTGRVNGYYLSSQNLMQLVVRNAGHMVPMDQPEAALEMLRLFIYEF
ncbi:probable serine carboxypeptidase CPVL [Octopus sinensis]|uniref:Carboxypeptidase n=1 Tax=Octopus sinensis TaxID=2607531 RepID=A0A6P7TUI7_9MOLL|nr:probable serine carboxypeptidase CPVL [Octopus sinensis]